MSLNHAKPHKIMKIISVICCIYVNSEVKWKYQETSELSCCWFENYGS